MYDDVLNHTSEAFQMQNSDHHLLSWTGIAKTFFFWQGVGEENVRDYLIQIACIFSKPFICNICKKLYFH